jgi:peptidoglycan hydrolase-like protein with peptidoglycan-binding domain
MKKIIIAISFLGILGSTVTSSFAGYFNTTPVNVCNAQITHTLQTGSENNDVRVLQNMLSHAGYLYAQPNGYFGPSTKAAVKRFQGANGLPQTGIVGEATRNVINERLCDSDVRGESLSYDAYGYTSGITYVDQYDPNAIVISPQVTTPVVYATPQENTTSFSTTLNETSNISGYSQNIYPSVNSNFTVPATSQAGGTSIVYNPNVGYSYGISQKSGSLTITSPRTNSIYNEGDTVNLTWYTDSINATGFQIFVENTSTGQSRQVGSTRNMSASFVLSKDLLDAICSGSCTNNQLGSFKFVITTPVTDIAGITSNFRAAVSPITIRRPYSVSAAVSLTTSKTPVDSAEKFKLFVSAPSLSSLDASVTGSITMKLHAACINSVQVSLAGVPCGQDLTMPASTMTSQQGIPVMITNTTWYKQDIVFEVYMFNLAGQVMGTSKVVVTVNPTPFAW